MQSSFQRSRWAGVGPREPLNGLPHIYTRGKITLDLDRFQKCTSLFVDHRVLVKSSVLHKLQDINRISMCPNVYARVISSVYV